MIRDLGIRSHIHPAGRAMTAARLGAALQSAMRGRQERAAYRYPLIRPISGSTIPKPVIEATLTLNNIPYRRAAISRKTSADGWPRARWSRSCTAATSGGRGRSARARSSPIRARAEMKDHLNAKIKFREEFRPFAPVVKEEAYGDWFETLGMAESPYMLYTHKALRPDQTAAVTHVDGTSRVQTVSAEQNPYLYRIIDAFERRTGVPVLINTSFNLRGEPIVSSPSDALKTFFASGIDCLAMEDFVVEKPGGAAVAAS